MASSRQGKSEALGIPPERDEICHCCPEGERRKRLKSLPTKAELAGRKQARMRHREVGYGAGCSKYAGRVIEPRNMYSRAGGKGQVLFLALSGVLTTRSSGRSRLTDCCKH